MKTEKIKGTHFNLRDPFVTGLLEASIDDGADIISTSINKNDRDFITYINIQMISQKYSQLKKEKTTGLHEGYRHIEIWDASDLDNLNFGNTMNYLQLKHYELEALIQKNKS